MGNREGNGTPLQYSCLKNPMDGGAWWAAVHGVAKSQIRLSDFTFPFHFHALEKAENSRANKNTTYLNADYQKLTSDSSERMGGFPGGQCRRREVEP